LFASCRIGDKRAERLASDRALAEEADREERKKMEYNSSITLNPPINATPAAGDAAASTPATTPNTAA